MGPDLNGRRLLFQNGHIFFWIICVGSCSTYFCLTIRARGSSLPLDSTSEMRGLGLIHDNQREGNLVAQLRPPINGLNGWELMKRPSRGLRCEAISHHNVIAVGLPSNSTVGLRFSSQLQHGGVLALGVSQARKRVGCTLMA